jgi:hypothetical protein
MPVSGDAHRYVGTLRTSISRSPLSTTGEERPFWCALLRRFTQSSLNKEARWRKPTR